MATLRHPITGVIINDIGIVRTKRLTEEEQLTARLLMEGGDTRCLAAAKLGVHPLAINATGQPRPGRGAPRGATLSSRHAFRDQRQTSMFDASDSDAAMQDDLPTPRHHSTPARRRRT